MYAVLRETGKYTKTQGITIHCCLVHFSELAATPCGLLMCVCVCVFFSMYTKRTHPQSLRCMHISDHHWPDRLRERGRALKIEPWVGRIGQTFRPFGGEA